MLPTLLVLGAIRLRLALPVKPQAAVSRERTSSPHSVLALLTTAMGTDRSRSAARHMAAWRAASSLLAMSWHRACTSLRRRGESDNGGGAAAMRAIMAAKHPALPWGFLAQVLRQVYRSVHAWAV